MSATRAGHGTTELACQCCASRESVGAMIEHRLVHGCTNCRRELIHNERWPTVDDTPERNEQRRPRGER